MNETDQAEFIIDVSAADPIVKKLGRIKRRCCFTLQAAGVESLNAARTRDTISVASITISTLPILLPAGIRVTIADDLQKLLTSTGKGMR